jgi:hypothetical protein
MNTNPQSSTATNLTGPDLATTTATTTQQYFNNFYSAPFNVSANTNDAITAFFEEYSPNATAARNLAGAVIYTAIAQNLDPLKILSDFESLPRGQLNNYLVAFLNSTRVPTSVLGINNGTKTSPYITRTILA